MGLLAMVASGVRGALRPGGPGIAERLRAAPRMVASTMRGDYPGLGLARLAMLGLAAAYVVSPVDLMPEALLGVFGVADDAIVVTWIVAALVHDTEDFLLWERAKATFGGQQDPQDAPPSGPQDATWGTAGSAGSAPGAGSSYSGGPTVTSKVVG